MCKATVQIHKFWRHSCKFLLLFFSFFFSFFVGGLGVDEMAEWLSFLRGQGVAGVVVWSTLFFG